jgi:hypothetical protein
MYCSRSSRSRKRAKLFPKRPTRPGPLYALLSPSRSRAGLCPLRLPFYRLRRFSQLAHYSSHSLSELSSFEEKYGASQSLARGCVYSPYL